MRRSPTTLRCFSTLFLAVLLGGAAAAKAPLVLGTYAYPALDRERALDPLATLVETAFSQPVEIKLYKDPDAVAAAVTAGEVDVAVLNLGAWLRVARVSEVTPLAMLVPTPKVQDRYRAVLLARPALGLANLAQVADSASRLRLAAVLPGSTSGGLVQLAALNEAGGAAPRWHSVVYAGSHEAALTALANGDADLAAVAESPWRAWLGANPDPSRHPQEVWRSAPLPSGPLVCRQSARLDCTMLGTTLTSGSAASRNAAQELATGWPELAGAEQFFAYDPARYAGLINAGMPEFEADELRDGSAPN